MGLALLPAAALGQGLWVPAQIHGLNLTVLLDTGSSHWVLSERTARQMGLPLGDIPARLMTTSGPVDVFGAVLTQVRLQNHILDSQQAWIVPGEYPRHPLAGLSAIKNLKVEIQHGRVNLLKP